MAKKREPVVVKIGGKEFLLGRGGTQSGYPLVLSNAEQAIQCGEFNSPTLPVRRARPLAAIPPSESQAELRQP